MKVPAQPEYGRPEETFDKEAEESDFKNLLNDNGSSIAAVDYSSENQQFQFKSEHAAATVASLSSPNSALYFEIAVDKWSKALEEAEKKRDYIMSLKDQIQIHMHSLPFELQIPQLNSVPDQKNDCSAFSLSKTVLENVQNDNFAIKDEKKVTIDDFLNDLL